jgi:hypothetical protein
MLARVAVPGDKASAPLFGDIEIDRLAPAIAGALAKAGPDQELIFTISGPHAMFSLFTKQYTDSGRIFYADGRLNIIMGSMLREDYVNPRSNGLHGLPVGSRARAAEDVRLAAPSAADGQLKRADWLVLNPAAIATPSAVAVQTQGSSAPAAPIQMTLPAQHSLDNTEESRLNKLETRLLLLRRLHDQGLLTDAEFEQKRAEIVKQM